MKRLVIVLAAVFVISALTSVVAALGLQRAPDRSPTARPPASPAPAGVSANDTYRVTPAPAAPEPDGLVSLSADEQTPDDALIDLNGGNGGDLPPLASAPDDGRTDADFGGSQPDGGNPADADPPADAEEEHIEGTDKPEAIEVAKATNDLLPDFNGLPVLVNRDNFLPRGYIPELAVVPGTNYQVTPETLAAYTLMMDDAKAAGHTKLRLQSAYRSYDTQSSLFERKVNKLKPEYGDNARARAAQTVAPPGQSEHQLGQAVDIANGSLVQSFGDTPAGMWLANNAHLYGFILRYPKGKTDITGILYEPWHFRYVGADAAAVIYENGWTFEEFFMNQ